MSSKLSKNTLEHASLIVEALVPLLIRSGIGYTEFASACKPAFYRSALNEANRTGQKQTDSSISLLSGLHRRDTASMRKAMAEDPSLANPPISKPVSVPKQVIARWLSQDIGDTIPVTTPDTLPDTLSDTAPHKGNANNDVNDNGNDGCNSNDSNTKPLAKDNQQLENKVVSFSNLVAQVSKDQHFRSILTELERIGIVEVNDGLARLKRSAFTPDPHLNEARELFASNISDHISAGISNIFMDTDSGETGVLEQAIFSDELTKESIEELHTLSNSLWFDTLNTVLKRAIELYERDQEILSRNVQNLPSTGVSDIIANKDGNEIQDNTTNSIDTYRFRLGMYAYHEVESTITAHHINKDSTK